MNEDEIQAAFEWLGQFALKTIPTSSIGALLIGFLFYEDAKTCQPSLGDCQEMGALTPFGVAYNPGGFAFGWAMSVVVFGLGILAVAQVWLWIQERPRR